MFRRAVSTAWPAVLESFFISLAGLIDTMMVASLGSEAVAAVGLTTQPKFLGMSPFIAVSIAVSALVARRKGEGKRDQANQVLLAALTVTVILCAAISVLCVAFAPPVMTISGSNADTHVSAVIYFRVIMGGMAFAMISFIINAAQRGSGYTRIAMTTNVVSSLVNICFNYLLIGGHCGFPRLGVFGAALATVLGTVVACIMSIASLFRKNSYVNLPFCIRERLRPTADIFRSIRGLSVNFLAENLLMRIGFLATAFIAARIGTDAFAAHNVGMNVLSLGFSFADGMQAAAVSLSGQALGAGDKEGAWRYASICQRIGFGISVVLAALLIGGGRAFYGLFFDEPHIVEMGVIISRYEAAAVVLQISQIIFGACLRAAGDARYCMIASTVSVTVIRASICFVLTVLLNMGLHGIWLGILSDQLSRFLFMWLRFRKGDWVDLKI